MKLVISSVEDIEKYNPYVDLLEYKESDFFEDKFMEYFRDFSEQLNILKEKLNHEVDREIDKKFERIVKKRNDEVIDNILKGHKILLDTDSSVDYEGRIASLKKKIRIIKDIILASESVNIKRLQKVDKLVDNKIDEVSLSMRNSDDFLNEDVRMNQLLKDFVPFINVSLDEYSEYVESFKEKIKEMHDYYRNNYSVKTATKYIKYLNMKVDKKLDYYANNFDYVGKSRRLIDELVKEYDNFEIVYSNYDEWVKLFKMEIKILQDKINGAFSSVMAKKIVKGLNDKAGKIIDKKAALVKYYDKLEVKLHMIFDTYKPGELDIFDNIFYSNEGERIKIREKYKWMTSEEKHVFEMRIYEQYIRNFKAKIREYNREIRRVYSSDYANKIVASVNKRADKLVREKAKEIGKPIPRNPWFIRKYLWADTENFMSKQGLAFRKFINPFMRLLVRVAMKNKYVIEERVQLDPTKQYVFVSTHYFTEDIISLYSSLGRQAYMLMGTTDQIENNFLMLAAIMLGLFYVDREDNVSRKECIDKQNRIIELGSNVVNYVGGSWENSENELQPLSFSGPYKTSLARNVEIVPVALYLVREEKKIYIRYGEPMCLCDVDEKRANEIIRDTLASMHYKQIERHSIPIDSVSIDGYGRTHNLPYDQHTYYMEQVGNEYWNQYWSKPFAKEEIGLRPKKVVDEADVYSFVDNLSRDKLIELSKQLSQPMLRRYEREERYNMVKYIDENYERFRENNSGIKRRKKNKGK